MKAVESPKKVKLVLVILFVAGAVLPAAAKAQIKVSDSGKERVDLYGDPLGAGAAARLGTRRLRHIAEVQGVAFSPDGKLVASAGAGDGIVAIWQAADGKLVHWLKGHTHGVSCVAFSPDGKVLASGSGNTEQLILWDVSSGKILRELKQRGPSRCIAFSTDGRTMAVIADGGTILWDPQTGQKVRNIGTSADWSGWIGFSDDGNTVTTVSSGKDGYWVKLWNAADAEQVREFKGEGPLAVSADGKVIAEARTGGVLRIVDAASGKMGSEFPAPTAGIKDCEHIVFSPDGTCVASGWREHTFRIGNLKTGKEIVDGARGVSSLAFSGDGKMVAVADRAGKIELLDAATGREVVRLPSHSQVVEMVAFSPDGRTITTKGKDGMVCRWDARTGVQQGMFRIPVPYWHCVVTPDARLLATRAEDKSMCVYDMTTGAVVHKIDAMEGWANQFALSPDGKVLAIMATREQEGIVRLLEVASGREVMQFKVGGRDSQKLMFSPDGKILALSGYAGAIHMRREGTSQGSSEPITLWDAATGKELMKLGTGADPVSSIAFSPDGRMLVSAHGQLNMRRGTGREGSVVSADASNTLCLWDLRTGEQLKCLKGHEGPVASAVFSPDGRLVASGSSDGTSRLWEVRSGRQVAMFADQGWQTRREFQKPAVRVVAFSPDGQFLASGGADGTVVLWDMKNLAQGGS